MGGVAILGWVSKTQGVCHVLVWADAGCVDGMCEPRGARRSVAVDSNHSRRDMQVRFRRAGGCSEWLQRPSGWDERVDAKDQERCVQWTGKSNVYNGPRMLCASAYACRRTCTRCKVSGPPLPLLRLPLSSSFLRLWGRAPHRAILSVMSSNRRGILSAAHYCQ